MTIAKDKVVSIDYTLKDAQGIVLDSSEGSDPMPYLHGAGTIVAGLESELEGKSVGDEITVEVSPQDGYGERDESLVADVSKESFEDADAIEIGDELQAESDEAVYFVTVTSIDEEFITVDGNHPLAGLSLHFQVKVTDIRDATEDELAHGHVHGPGCDH
ncbi:MAG: peptidylprolyl isomerase [Planctomycetota bacterium]|nr:peptidylprolyl isomerase [Planctomycetota bacterium]